VRAPVGVAAIAAVLTAAVGVYVVSPRFSAVRGPSLVDDWTQLYNSPFALHQLEHLSFNPGAYDAMRYRPAFWLWSYLQWHTLGAPQAMAGPNAWNVLRICALALALALVAVATVHPRHRREHPVLLGLLAAVPGILVFSTPAFGVDLTRLGPQEPLLIAGIGLGGLTLLLAAWLALERRAHLAVVGLVGLLGLVVWTFGVYTKEAAICVFVLAPFLALELRARWPRPEASRARIGIAAAIGVLAIVPLLQLTVQLIHLAGARKLVYNSTPPHGVGQWLTRIGSTLSQQWNGIPAHISTGALWQGLAIVLPLMLVAVWWRTRRPQWLALGMLLLGWSVLVFQGLPKVVDPRYYMPVFAAFAIVLVALLAELPSALRTTVLSGVAVLALIGIVNTHTAVQGWVAGEQKGEQLVRATARLNPRRCPVYYTNFDPERHTSLPTVLAALYPGTGAPCLSGQASLVVQAAPPLPNPAAEPIVATCAPPGWQERIRAGLGALYSCARLSTALVSMPNGSELPPSRVLPRYRLTLPKSPPVPVPFGLPRGSDEVP
jgi:hypothetical protein